jgi:ankyrin repeat protein
MSVESGSLPVVRVHSALSVIKFRTYIKVGPLKQKELGSSTKIAVLMSDALIICSTNSGSESLDIQDVIMLHEIKGTGQTSSADTFTIPIGTDTLQFTCPSAADCKAWVEALRATIITATASHAQRQLELSIANFTVSCADGIVEQATKLFESRPALLSYKNHAGQSGLHLAVAQNHTNVVSSLLDCKADLELTDSHGRTLLHCACFHAAGDVTKLLLEKKANFGALDDEEHSPLYLAAVKADDVSAVECIRALVEAGSDPNGWDTKDVLPLLTIVAALPRPCSLSALLESGASEDLCNLWNASEHVLQSGQVIPSGANLCTLQHVATGKYAARKPGGYWYVVPEPVSMLVFGSGEDCHIRQMEEKQYMRHCRYGGQTSTQAYQDSDTKWHFREKGNDIYEIVNARGPSYLSVRPSGTDIFVPSEREEKDAARREWKIVWAPASPLHAAAAAGVLAAVKILLGHGSLPNLVDHMGNTALHFSTGEVAQYLLAHGARPDIVNGKNVRADHRLQIEQSAPVIATYFSQLVVLGDGKTSGEDAWVSDDTSETCMLCNCSFGFITRRHHCRRCGALVCSNCSSKSFFRPNEMKLRACDKCFNILSFKAANDAKEIKAPAPRCRANDAELSKVCPRLR